MVDCADSASNNRKAIKYLSLYSGQGVLTFGNRCLVHQLFRGGAGRGRAQWQTENCILGPIWEYVRLAQGLAFFLNPQVQVLAYPFRRFRTQRPNVP